MSFHHRAGALLRRATSLVARSILRDATNAIRVHREMTEKLEERRLLARATGIDVSSHSGIVDWSQVASAGYSFAYARSSEGVGFTDARLAANLNAGAAAGLLMGAYHHATPTTVAGDAVAEADYFVSIAGEALAPGSLRPALDVSEGSGMGKAALSTWVNAFIDRVESTSGVEPIVYTNNDYATNWLDGSVAANRDLWIARWSTAFGDPLTNGSPPTGAWAGIGETWDVWQYSNSGSVPGVGGSVDRNVFNGDRAALESFVIEGAAPAAFTLNLDFGPAGASVPSGYVGVGGTLFGAQSGQQMGWLQSGVTTYTRTGGTAPDDRYRTYAMPALNGVSRAFEVEVPNGSYTVRVVAGSPDQTGNNQKITVEGTTAINKMTTSAVPFVTGTVTVDVTDGRLTLGSDHNGWANTRLAFVDIAKIDAVVAGTGFQTSVNFAPDGSKAVIGYRTDLGNSIGLRSNGHTFGWRDAATDAPTPNGNATFNHGGNTDRRLATGIGTAGKAWEMQLPNGTYYVKLVAGDANVTSGTYGYDVEGTALLNGTAASGNGRWITGQGVVTVSDGRLTIRDLAGKTNHALAYVEITDAVARTRSAVAAPTNVVATAAGDNVVDVRWTDTSDNETTFRVDRADNLGGPWTTLGTTHANAGLYVDDTGGAGMTYVYRVSAMNGSSASGATVSNTLVTPTSGQTGGRMPYNPTRSNWATGTTIQAEDYDFGGDGVTYSDLTDGNAGGYYRSGSGDIGYNVVDPKYFLGWTKSGEWVEYTIDVAQAGTYRLDASVASDGLGGTFSVLLNGTTKAAGVRVTDTGSFNSYQTIGSSTFALAAGSGQVLRILTTSDDPTNAWVGDVDWLKLVFVSEIEPSPAPSGLAATAVSTTQIDLTWTDNATDEAGFRILRSTDGTTFTTLINLAANTTTYSDINVTPNTTYSYRIVSINAAGASTASNTATATAATPTAPASPRSVSATGLTASYSWVADGIELAWTLPTGVAPSSIYMFGVERKLSDGTWYQVGSVYSASPSDLHWSDDKVTRGETYEYRVITYAEDADGKIEQIAQAQRGPVSITYGDKPQLSWTSDQVTITWPIGVAPPAFIDVTYANPATGTTTTVTVSASPPGYSGSNGSGDFIVDGLDENTEYDISFDDPADGNVGGGTNDSGESKRIKTRTYSDYFTIHAYNGLQDPSVRLEITPSRTIYQEDDPFSPSEYIEEGVARTDGETISYQFSNLPEHSYVKFSGMLSFVPDSSEHHAGVTVKTAEQLFQDVTLNGTSAGGSLTETGRVNRPQYIAGTIYPPRVDVGFDSGWVQSKAAQAALSVLVSGMGPGWMAQFGAVGLVAGDPRFEIVGSATMEEAEKAPIRVDFQNDNDFQIALNSYKAAHELTVRATNPVGDDTAMEVGLNTIPGVTVDGIQYAEGEDFSFPNKVTVPPRDAGGLREAKIVVEAKDDETAEGSEPIRMQVKVAGKNASPTAAAGFVADNPNITAFSLRFTDVNGRPFKEYGINGAKFSIRAVLEGEALDRVLYGQLIKSSKRVADDQGVFRPREDILADQGYQDGDLGARQVDTNGVWYNDLTSVRDASGNQILDPNGRPILQDWVANSLKVLDPIKKSKAESGAPDIQMTSVPGAFAPQDAHAPLSEAKREYEIYFYDPRKPLRADWLKTHKWSWSWDNLAGQDTVQGKTLAFWTTHRAKTTKASAISGDGVEGGFGGFDDHIVI